MDAIELAFAHLSRRMLSLERFGVETFLFVCSTWAARRLLTPPSNFAGYEAGFAFMAAMKLHEADWGVGIAVAAVLQLVGLGLAGLRRSPMLSMQMRCIGLLMSGFFWTVIGSSFLVGNPDTIAGVPLVLLGCSAWWTLLRFPSLPNHPSGLLP